MRRDHIFYSVNSRIGVLFLWILILFSGTGLFAQDVPSKPLSIPVYHPMILNPGFVGSKDYTNISLTSRVLKSPDSQILNAHKRLMKRSGDYSRFGLGAYLSQEQLDPSWNAGAGVAISYHYALDDEHLHNLSGGLTAKGFLTVPKTDSELVDDSASAVFSPDLDAGMYYYGPHGFAGLSVTSLFGDDARDDTLNSFSSIHRQYHIHGGYKFIVSKKHGIVIEPSLLVSLEDGTFSEIQKHLVPYLKVYLQNFYIGSYLKDFDTFSLFFQYQFPRFYTGVFLEFPRVGYLNDDNIIFELSLGMNLGREGANFLKYRHW